MPNLKRRTKSGYRRNAIGTARPFLMGLEHPMILPNQQFEMQAFTEVSGIPQEKTDATTFTMPSDTDGFELDEITTAYGGFQSQTATLTEYMDERQNTPYLAGVRRDLPVALLLPQGKNRLLSDKDDFESAILVEHGFITSDTQDDNFNTSDGDVANPNKISVNYAFHGRHRHIFKPVDLNAGEIGSGWTATKPITGVAVLEEREDGGAKSRQFFAVEDIDNALSTFTGYWVVTHSDSVPTSSAGDFINQSFTGGSVAITGQVGHRFLWFALPKDSVYDIRQGATARFSDFTQHGTLDFNGTDYYLYATIQSQADASDINGTWTFREIVGAKLWRRDKYKNWEAVVSSFGASNSNTSHSFKKLAVAGGSLITLQNKADTGSGHWVFSLDDLTADPTFVTSDEWDDETFPEDIYVKSPTEIFFVGGRHHATNGEAKILKANGPLDTSVDVVSEGYDSGVFYAIHGRGEQLVVGGGLGTDKSGSTPELQFSNDSGETWSEVFAPPGIGTGAITAVYMIAKDAFWVANARGKLRFTYDRGETWINKDSAMSSVGIGSISVLQFVEPSGADRSSFIGIVAGSTGWPNVDGSTLRVARTLDGGATWSRGGSYIAKDYAGTATTSNQLTSWLDLALADAQSFMLAGSSNNGSIATLVEYE